MHGILFRTTDVLTASLGHTYEYLPTVSLWFQQDESTNIQKTYTYNAANLLESIAHAGVNDPSEMTWDADGNRITFTSSEDSGTTKFVYDTTAGIPAVIEEVLPSTSSVYYIREPNGSLIARVAGAATSYYHFDALGSTRLLTDSAGAVTDTYSYDAWGNTTHDTGSLVQPYQYVGQLGYYTHYQDTNLAMLQLGVRFYDPELGRFTQVDPIGQGVEPYAYAADTPTSNVDPSGFLPGRYRDVCGKICSRKGKAAKKACAQCKKRIDWACAVGRDLCCFSDKEACNNDCGKKYPCTSSTYQACIDSCQLKEDNCMLDGKPFE